MPKSKKSTKKTEPKKVVVAVKPKARDKSYNCVPCEGLGLETLGSGAQKVCTSCKGTGKV